jgi:spermidine synthase
VIPVGLALAERPQRVLIVGLGGGTIPSMFRKYLPDLQIDTVELDPEVVQVAKQYFGFREDAGCEPTSRTAASSSSSARICTM